jgi:hypothetical protein
MSSVRSMTPRVAVGCSEGNAKRLRHGPGVWMLERLWCSNECPAADELVLDAEPRANNPNLKPDS